MARFDAAAKPEQEEYYREAYQKGVVAPSKPLSEHNDEFPLLSSAADRLVELSRVLGERGLRAVVCFDSLDRISDPVVFGKIVEQDVAALRLAGIGVVLAGPLRSLYGADRTIFDRFDYFYHQPAIDAQQDAAGLDFLVRVLRARVGADILPDVSCSRLGGYSGGVLRDLITLAQAAGEEAPSPGAAARSHRLRLRDRIS